MNKHESYEYLKKIDLIFILLSVKQRIFKLNDDLKLKWKNTRQFHLKL